MLSLGIVYENSLGVTKDHKEAVEWYRKSARLGDKRAKKHLQTEMAGMSG